MTYQEFYNECKSNHLVRRCGIDNATAIIDEVWMELDNDMIPSHGDKYQTALLRVKNRCSNLLSRGHLYLKLLDEDIVIDFPHSELTDWCAGSCTQESLRYYEEPFPTVDTLADTIASLTSQQSRHFNNELKHCLPLCNNDVQLAFLEATAKATKIRYDKKHKKNK